jgi:surfeit locus 1 family protein
MRLFGRPFRPRLWPTLMALPAFLALIALGLWQLDRLGEKQALIATLEARWSEVATPFPEALGDIADWEYRRVLLTGRFLHEQEFLFPGKPYKGTVGYWIATPFVLNDGRTVIVDRGWVPDRYVARASRPEGLPAGEVTVEGILRRPGWPGGDWMKPENDPAHNQWAYVDTEAMAVTAGLERTVTEAYVIALGDEATGIMPIGRELGINLPNDHLQYAITWFSLAIALLVIYLLFHLRPEGRDGRA